MKANELRIGNWVLNNGKPYQILNGIDNEHVYGLDSVILDSHIYKSSLEDIEPITLTEEILLKCGFEKITDGWLSNGFFQVGKRYLFWCKSDKCWYLNTSSILAYCNNIDSVKYLHELQNVYYWSSKDDYMFKREELEINLKF